MAPGKLIDTGAAAKLKGCTRQAILDAIRRGAIDGEQLSRYYAVRDNAKFQAWEPNPVRQKIGRQSQAPARTKRKSVA